MAAESTHAAGAPAHSVTDLALVQQQREIRSLAARDREVRAHEQAHASVGGVHAGSPVYEYVRGPNGVRYAHGGHVSIDVSEVPGNPTATLRKMRTVARAALAPAQPSAQDRAVAARANAEAAQAQAEVASEQNERLHETLQGRRPPIGSTSGSLLDIIL